MHRLKRDLWRASIACAGMLLLLVFVVWASAEAAQAHGVTSGLASSGTAVAQATPTEDATVTVLNKEKLQLDIEKDRSGIDKDRSDIFWAWTSIGIILVGVVGAIFTFFRFLSRLLAELFEREKRREVERIEREKREEERFQAVVEGLGTEKEETKIGAAIVLRTFLRPGYERFYIQAFDLAVANLRLPRTARPPEDPNAAQPITTLIQALVVVFKEAFPLARNRIIGDRKDALQSLDATGIQLDNAYLSQADLEQAWMPIVSMKRVDLRDADLRNSNLRNSNLRNSNLMGIMLSEADLSEADLRNSNLRNSNLRNSNLMGIMLSEADLSEADLRNSNLSEANLSRAKLVRANLVGVDLSKADLSDADLSGTSLEDALSLRDTNLRRVTGLRKEQLAACKAKGAVIDEATETSSPQSTISPLQP